uniref:Sulfate transport system permease protein n=1 Tax=Sciadococcus taiwanensis TaxID=3028030 RepID=A0A9Y1I228_9RHOD|nr:sulfate transport system permease protein [Sciadococcus taiwanensis]
MYCNYGASLMLNEIRSFIKRSKKQFIKWGLISVSYLYLSLFLFFPSINVFLQAFSGGIRPFLANLFHYNFLHALKLTILISIFTLPLNVAFGLSMAYIIYKYKFIGKSIVLSLLDLPFSISPIIAGLMITLLYGKYGWIGTFFVSRGIRIIFALPGMILASTFVTLPFIVREILPILEEIGEEQEEAAKTMGANEYQVFWEITLPNIQWGLLYGIILTNARAIGEFGAVSVISGNIIGKTQTLTLFVEQAYKEYETHSSFSAAVFLFILALFTILFKELLIKS